MGYPTAGGVHCTPVTAPTMGGGTGRLYSCSHNSAVGLAIPSPLQRFTQPCGKRAPRLAPKRGGSRCNRNCFFVSRFSSAAAVRGFDNHLPEHASVLPSQTLLGAPVVADQPQPTSTAATHTATRGTASTPDTSGEYIARVYS